MNKADRIRMYERARAAEEHGLSERDPWWGRVVVLAMGVLGGFGLARWRGREREKKHEEQVKALEASTGAAVEASALCPSPLPTEAYREPDLEAVIHLPVDREDFDTLNEAVCTCLHALGEDGEPVHAEELRDCVLDAIYPDFEWPPVPGDPTAAGLMWRIADHEARKAVADPSRCPLPPGEQGEEPGGALGAG